MGDLVTLNEGQPTKIKKQRQMQGKQQKQILRLWRRMTTKKQWQRQPQWEFNGQMPEGLDTDDSGP
jgi:hypothetical protein